ncbi:MAG: sigma factor [Phycisphaerales bacterium]
MLLSVFTACSAALFRFLMVRAGNDRALCDDLMQTLWLRASQGAPGRGEVPEGEIEFWLRAVARNLLVTHLRKRRSGATCREPTRRSPPTLRRTSDQRVDSRSAR